MGTFHRALRDGMRLRKEEPHVSFGRKEPKGMRNYHFLVKLVSPSKLVQHNDGSVAPSIRSLVREYFIITARFKLLLPRTRSFLVSHPASWIDVQSLPRGCRFLMPIHQVRVCTSHQEISCQRLPSASHPPLLRGFG